MTESDVPEGAAVPSGGTAPPRRIVGIGASAGALTALRSLLRGAPTDAGFAFVIVVHLAREHKSHLAELLQPHADMPVQQVTETVALRPDHVYVIPPNAHLNTVDTHLRLSDPPRDRSDVGPIDHFFRTLAATHGLEAVGMILTGTGSDGALGLREIHEQGGLAIVQDPADAEFDGMPQSAVATGVADLVLPLERIPDALANIASASPRLRVPVSDDAVQAGELRTLDAILAQIRMQANRDFSRYKRTTILRRIFRRMTLKQVELLEDYNALLRDAPDEARALADDLLVTVTSFFRDAEVYTILEERVIPAMLEGKGPQDTVRVWTVGCATGEEIYSIAMLLLEAVSRREAAAPRVQLFASDLHERSLASAREGFYAGEIAGDVGPERLQRFFVEEEGGYRLRQHVRELVVFSEHNLLSDPPFSRLDLITCRNLLIYLDREVQGEVVELFHYALRPDGYLMLGTSETMDSRELFAPLEETRCVFQRRNVRGPDPRLPVFPMSRRTVDGGSEAPGHARQRRVPYADAHERMLERYGPPSVLVDVDDRVVHLSMDAGRYLMQPGGEITSNLFTLVREELRIELRAAMQQARRSTEPIRTAPVPVRFDGETSTVEVEVRPGRDSDYPGHLLLVFNESGRTARPRDHDTGGATTEPSAADSDPERKGELERVKQQLQAVIEQYETSQEELRASNEELQSSNEELRSTLEELETGKEELQSMNEELQTVNQENRNKVEELSQLSDDLQNLLAASDIATLFLDRELRIMRFTPRAVELFNLRSHDRGRPISDITHQLSYDSLIEDAESVLRRLVPVERELVDEGGHWFLTRVLPYRSADDRIDGVVLTFVEITARKEVESALRESELRLRAILNASSEALYRMSADWSVMYQLTSRGFLTETEDANPHWLMAYIHPDDHEEVLAAIDEAVRTRSTFELDHRVRRADDSYGWVMSRAVPLLDDDGEVVEWVGAANDVTDKKRAEDELRIREARYRALAELSPEAILVSAGGRLVFANRSAAGLLGAAAPDDLLGQDPIALVQAGDQDLIAESIRHVVRTGEATRRVEQQWKRLDGTTVAVEVAVGPIDWENDVSVQFVATDITRRKETEDALRNLTETLERRVEERTRQVRELSQTLTLAEQKERQRLSRVLHDDLQQLLYSVQMKVALAGEHAEEADLPGVVEQTGRSITLLEEAITRTRQLTVDLNPPILEGEGLQESLEWLRTQMFDLHGLEVEVRAQEPVEIADPDLRILVFQVVRELLFNVAKHAETDRATVELASNERRVRVAVADRGRGFVTDQAHDGDGHRGLGLLSAKERLRMYGGDLEVRSAPGEGTTAVIDIAESGRTGAHRGTAE